MYTYPYKTYFILLTLGLFMLQLINGHRDRSHRNGVTSRYRHEINRNIERRTRILHNNKDATQTKDTNHKRTMKRQNVTAEKDSDLLTKKAEDIFMDEITGSDQAANRAEISYDIPKEVNYLESDMKAGDSSDIDTANMIDINEKKGAYLPVANTKATVRAKGNARLTDQFRNIAGLPEFMLKPKLKNVKSASLIEKVADSLQPRANAMSGIKQLLEETKVEQSLKKHLDNFPSSIANNIANTNMVTTVPDFANAVPENANTVQDGVLNSVPENANTVPESANTVPEAANTVPETANTVPETADAVPNPPVPNEPSIIDTNVNTVPNEAQVSPGYVSAINPDQVYDESISPPEQLLDDLSTGKFKHPLSDTVLDRMSDWNPNKEYLADNGYSNPANGVMSPKLTRISSEIMPVHDLYLKPKPVKPTELYSKQALEYFRKDPEVLGRNQELLNSNQYHSLSDLDAIGPPIYPEKVVRLPHRPKHIYLPSKHVFTHIKAPDVYHDVDEGVAHDIHGNDIHGDDNHNDFHGDDNHNDFHGDDNHDNHHTEDTIDDDGEISPNLYHPHHEVHSARCSYKPCLNGGKCTALIDRYVCTCREGFMGVNCQKRSYCYPTPCKHGSCSSNTDGFVCTCESGWQGKRCDERDKCHPSPCMHGGTCTSTYSGVYCSCLSGFKGRYCESEAKCSPLNPCLNGGRCQEMPFSYICICKNGFAGKNCETILRPTSMPPTIALKPVPPQAIPIPHNQPPFLLEELNSLSDGPMQEHALPESTFDNATPLGYEHNNNHHEHHEEEHPFPDIFDEHFEDNNHHDQHHHDSTHLAINGNPGVIIHMGDKKKDKKDDKKVDTKKKKNPPTSFKQDDRYVTHLVAATMDKGKPVNEEKQNKDKEAKKPPMEKPTAKQDKPKEKIPTAQTLMRLQQQKPENFHLDDNRVYTGPGGHPGDLDQIDAHADHHAASPVSSMRPAVKHQVLKANKMEIKNKPRVRPHPKPVQRPRVVWARPNAQQKGQTSKKIFASKKKPAAVSRTAVRKPLLSCPSFCKEFCDVWCVGVGCCKKVEIKGPTEAKNPIPAVLSAIEKKGKNFIPTSQVDD